MGFTPLARGWREAEESSSCSTAGVGGGDRGTKMLLWRPHVQCCPHKSGSSNSDGADPVGASTVHDMLVKR